MLFRSRRYNRYRHRKPCTNTSNIRTTIRKLQTRKSHIQCTYQTLQQLATQQPNKNRSKYVRHQTTTIINKIDKTEDNPTPDNQWSQINPSCLLAYSGIRGYAYSATTSSQEVEVQKMAVPLLGYFDIPTTNPHTNPQSMSPG